jgi:hypothetical protein
MPSLPATVPVLRSGLFAALVLMPALGGAYAASSPTPSPAIVSGSTAAAHSSPAAHDPVPAQWAEAQHIFDQLSEDQKKKFLDNLNQWKAMSPEEQELYRDRELFRRQKITQEIQDAITKSGLHLDDDQREVFTLRYTQERRKIEEALRKEMDEQRQSMVTDMLSHLKGEFSSPPPPPIVIQAPTPH